MKVLIKLLSLADLYNAFFGGVDLSDATLYDARWCDGKCLCAYGSIGTWGGCPLVDICTGL